MSKDTLNIKVSEGKTSNKNENEFNVVDPIRELNLGEQAWKIEKAPMEDTEKKLKGLGLLYYMLRGGEILSKQFDDSRENVIFNKGEKDQFSLPTEPKAVVLQNPLDKWYSNKEVAMANAKLLTSQEQERTHGILEQWQKADAMYINQLEREVF